MILRDLDSNLEFQDMLILEYSVGENFVEQILDRPPLLALRMLAELMRLVEKNNSGQGLDKYFVKLKFILKDPDHSEKCSAHWRKYSIDPGCTEQDRTSAKELEALMSNL